MFTFIDVPGSGQTMPHGINSSGQIVGIYSATENGGVVWHGFLFDHGAFTTIDFPGSTLTDAGGINAQGQIVGTYSAAWVTSRIYSRPWNIYKHGCARIEQHRRVWHQFQWPDRRAVQLRSGTWLRRDSQLKRT